ncbi:MAG: flagellar hook-basal body complex protein FliE [Lachnospiraceae bacterium]|nr:flagellar hook-basal body complex protein FliE [Lachnospiraceae bacterium]
MDISSLYNISSNVIKEAANTPSVYGMNQVTETTDGFDSILNKAIDSLNTTNAYLSDAENEELRWALGETDNTHDLTIALQKASTALQYTVAVRDKFLEAYKEIMQMQI